EPEGDTTLELHVTPGSAFGIAWPVEQMMARSQPVMLDGGLALRVLEPADEFVFLSAHGLGHQFARLQWLLDLALLSRRVDLAALDRRARELGAGHVVRATRHLLCVRLGVSSLPHAGW